VTQILADPAAQAAGSVPLAARSRGLRKVYGSTVAVEGIDLDVPAGAVLGMLGPNGSGKTTLIRMLLGLTRPTAGEAELLGHPLPDGAAAALPHVGALVEGPGFHPFLSGRDNLLRIAATEPLLDAPAIPAAVDAALERVGLAGAARRRFRGYSLGMKQRLGLAGALLIPRRLVVLDEPTNGLDPAGTRDVRRIIAELHGAGATVIVSSHLLAEVEATCTHVAVLQSGRSWPPGSCRRCSPPAPPGWTSPRRTSTARWTPCARPGSPPTARRATSRASSSPRAGRTSSRCWCARASRCTRPGGAGPGWRSCSRS
jgi:ABC-2 type transport system ATP-binding protein